ncbi:MAG: hypothetical protein GX089_06275 [Fibrobacter sp.]|nr:hypothetical protein [Fibrobacter sp.]
MRRYEKPIKDALSANRILIVSPFPDIVFKYSYKTILDRNRFMFELADKIVLGYIDPYGDLRKLTENLDLW